MVDLQFRDTAADGYDQTVGHWTRRIVPSLLHAARLVPGQRVLDVAAGTGLAAEAVLSVVGPSGHVIAADISPMMLGKAQQRLGGFPNITFSVEDGQALTFPDESVDAVICNMGLMYFLDPRQGLSEFRRVLRPAGRATVSVYMSGNNYHLGPGRSIMGGVLGLISKYVPTKAAETELFFTLGREGNLDLLFEKARFREVETSVEVLRYTLSSFDSYFRGVERGAGSTGQIYLALSENIRRSLRAEVREIVGQTDGPVEVEVEVRLASGLR